MKKALGAIGLVLLVLAAGAYLYSSYVIHQHRKLVLAKLNDPDSAQFRNEKLKGSWTVGGSILCGEINAKNAMGGYVGFVPFASTAGTEAEIGSDIGAKVFLEGYCE